jgi:replicative DNA helicase
LISGNGDRWHPAGVNAWLRELGIFGQRSHEKRVPEAAFRLANDQVALLLRHLWATDGSISPDRRGGPGVYYSTNSEGLARDVAALLMRVGIVTRMTVVDQGEYLPSFMVRVSGSTAQQRFLDLVGAFGPRALPAARLGEVIRQVRPNTNVDTLPIDYLRRVQQLMRERGIPRRELASLRHVVANTSYGLHFSPSRTLVAEYGEILDDDELRAAASSDLFWDKVISVEADGCEEVFDLTVPGPASWVTEGIATHNSGSLEQDADLVMFIYRDEVYHPDSNDKGTAEVILAKHRNGPVGKVKLTFLENYTKFANFSGGL